MFIIVEWIGREGKFAFRKCISKEEPQIAFVSF
jgi:hypothetical protein